MPERIAKKVLLIGWDAADWQFMNPLLDNGLMPTLNGLINRGVIGNLATLHPPLSPMLWTSIATGKRPHKHGIFSFVEPRPDGQGVQPVTSTSRRCKAIWNILSQSQLSSNIIGWYASHPAEPIRGAVVSNAFGRVGGALERPTRPPREAFHPRRLADSMSGFAIHPAELQAAHLAPFVPRLKDVPEKHQPTLKYLAEVLAECASTHAAATHLMTTEPWDFMAVFYDAIDRFGHEFMAYHPPRMEHIDSDAFELFQHVMTGAYRFHDMMLQTLLDLAGKETTVILISDHGFLSDEKRPVEAPGTMSAPTAWHRSHGIICMAGQGIKPDERIHGATVLDITPTILTMFGLPVGQDMDGRSLVSAFEHPPPVESIPTWEAVEGEAGMHPPSARQDPYEAQEALRQLAALGYINLPTGDAATAVRTAEAEAKLNLASSLMDVRQYDEAAAILQALREAHPDDPRFALSLARCELGRRRFDEARAPLEKLKAEGHYVGQCHLALARIEFASGRQDAAMEHLRSAESLGRPSAGLHADIAMIHESQKRWVEARQAYEQALKIDPDFAAAHCGLGMVAFGEKNYEQAIDHYLRALGLMHFYPRAHYFLAVALAKLGWWERAIAAFGVCTRMYPRMIHPHRFLAAIYAKLGHPTETLIHRRRVQALLAEARAAGVPLDPAEFSGEADLAGS